MKKKKVLLVILSATLVFSLFTFTGCSNDSNQESEVIISESENEGSNEVEENIESSEEDVTENAEDVEVEEINEVAADIKYQKEQLEDTVEPDFATQWIESPNNKLSACVEGRGPDGNEEGVGYIIVKNNETNEKWSYTVVDDNRQLSTKKIVWVDDENIASIVGLSYGTIALGGNVYNLDLTTENTTFIYDTESEKIQVLEAKNVDGKIELQIMVYEDDNFIEYHIESKTIEIQ
ncbi:DUF4652 domain-containing protein [Clostridium sp. DL1XJH146]